MSRSRRKTLITPYYRTCRYAKRRYHGAYRARERDCIVNGNYDSIDGYRVAFSDSWDWKEYTLYQEADFSIGTLTDKLKFDYWHYHYPTRDIELFCMVNGFPTSEFMQRLNRASVARYRSWLMAHYFGK